MSVSLDIARRYLFAQGSALSYVGRLALLGLVLSVAVLVVVLSVVNGFERELRERVLAVLPHVVAQAPEGLTLAQIEPLLAPPQISGLTGVAPFVEGAVLLSSQGEVRAATLTAVEVSTHDVVSDVGRYVLDADAAPVGLGVLDAQRFSVVIGAGLARDLDLEVGDSVLVVLPIGRMTPAGLVPRQKRFRVAGVFTSDSQLDGQAVFTNLKAGQVLFRTGDSVHGVQGRLADLFEFGAAGKFLESHLRNTGARISSWMRTYGPLYRAIAVQKLTMFVLLSFLVGVAAFNLVSGLVMIVEQRKNDVAVLRTLGARSPTLLMLFVLVGLSVAIVGVLMGLLLGVALAQALPGLFSWLNQQLDAGLMSQYFISYLPVDVRLNDLAQVGLASTVIALLATIYPAWRATRLLPSQVLAQE